MVSSIWVLSSKLLFMVQLFELGIKIREIFINVGAQQLISLITAAWSLTNHQQADEQLYWAMPLLYGALAP